MQHVARQALLRRQYDNLRHQLAASRSAADFFGRHASTSKVSTDLFLMRLYFAELLWWLWWW
jgi:hypothetical protein